MMKKHKIIITILLTAACTVSIFAATKGKFNGGRGDFTPPEGFTPPDGMPPQGNPPMGFEEEAKESPDFSFQNKTGKIEKDLYSNFKEDVTVAITFKDKKASVDKTAEGITVTEDKLGVTIENKGKAKVKYVLFGTLNGTLVLKNKNADCAIEMNNLTINSSEKGPALRLTSDNTRTFIVVPKGTVNTLTDNRTKAKSSELQDDKKGSVYAKGAIIITGQGGAGGKLTVNNKGYKHAVYSKDYIRISDVDLTVNSDGRDCIRAMNAVIVDSGNITLYGNGKVEDEESSGIKVEGEDSDDDEHTVTYNKGTGFIIINNGNIKIKTVGKGMTAHWKSDETKIGNSEYKEKDCNISLLYQGSFIDDSQTVPNPYVTINGGTIDIVTTGTPTDYCSPEGIEAKNNILINGGKITVNTTDDGINAGGGLLIRDGEINVTSTMNDAIDTNGVRGIEISGGTVYAIAVSNPAECAFDCDRNRFVITGGTVVGMGGGNYSNPTETECKQNVLVISSEEAVAGKTLSVLNSKKKAVFTYDVPSVNGMGYSQMIISVPALGSAESKFILSTGTKITTSKKVTTVGNVSGFGPGGGRGPGGGPGFGPGPGRGN